MPFAARVRWWVWTPPGPELGVTLFLFLRRHRVGQPV